MHMQQFIAPMSTFFQGQDFVNLQKIMNEQNQVAVIAHHVVDADVTVEPHANLGGQMIIAKGHRCTVLALLYDSQHGNTLWTIVPQGNIPTWKWTDCVRLFAARWAPTKEPSVDNDTSEEGYVCRIRMQAAPFHGADWKHTDDT